MIDVSHPQRGYEKVGSRWPSSFNQMGGGMRCTLCDTWLALQCFSVPSTNRVVLAWSIAAILVALAIPFLTNALDLHHWRALVGYALLAVAGLIPLVAWAVARRVGGKRQRKIKRARVIIRHLITQGDRLHHNPGMIPTATDYSGSGTFTIITRGERPSPVERWRGTVGEKLNHSPFRPGTGEWALTQHGNRISDVLDRLREIEADLEKWIEEDKR